MMWVVLELAGALICVVALGWMLARPRPHPAIWPVVGGLLSVATVVHAAEAGEWLGFAPMARFGEVISVLTPALWMFLIFTLRREKLEDELRDLQESVQQQDRSELLGLLAGSIAHDVRNTLQAMEMQADLIQEYPHDAQALKEAAETIHQAVEISNRLLSDLSHLDRRQDVELRPVDLGEVVRGSERLLARALPPTHTLQVQVQPGPLPIRAVPVQLQQVLLNLVVNARDAMNDGGDIQLAVGSEGSRAVLRVDDEGTGIPPDIREHIFEPRFTTKGRGTGLGLAIVWRIVQGFGGEIEVADRAPRGTRFEVRLPLAEAQRPEAIGSLPAPHQAPA